MKFERDESFSYSPLRDEKGRYYGERENGFVDFGSVSSHLLHKQSQYGSRYIDGAIDGYPNLGGGLRFQGDTSYYHGLSIHPEDIDEFVRRYHAWVAYSNQSVEEPDGNIVYLEAEEIEQIRQYLDEAGAFDTTWRQRQP